MTKARIDWASFWAQDFKREDWLVEPILPRGRSVSIYSPAKAGKSLLALDLAARLATGRRVLDRPEGEPMNVLYIDLEMTEGDLYERLEDMGYGPASDLSRLFYELLPNLPPLDTQEGGDVLYGLAYECNANLVIFDTVSRILQGNENDADTVRAFYRHTGQYLKALGCTVLRLDHTGKDASRGARGSSAKNDDVDLVWQLTASGGGATLIATHRRQSWIPDKVELVRLEDPTRHERGAQTWTATTSALAREMDELGFPADVSVRDAARMLKESGRGRARSAVTEAVRYRKANAGNTLRNACLDGNGNGVEEHPQIELEERLRNAGNGALAEVGNGVSPVGGHVTQPLPQHRFDWFGDD